MQRITIRILAISLCVHAVLDLLAILYFYNDRRIMPVWQNPVPLPEPDAFYTDATLMAARYGGSEGFWAVAWLVIVAAILVLGFILSMGSEYEYLKEREKPVEILESLRNYHEPMEGREYTIH